MKRIRVKTISIKDNQNNYNNQDDKDVNLKSSENNLEFIFDK